MGVPAFFRWLSKKYPSIVVHPVEDKCKIVDGVKIPVDISTPNPNGVEFDNLYLDMNGIIHPCCHPEDKPAPKNEDEMMVLIFEYIDRLMGIIRPRKLLYMAIDGVAPRAKMNQQRSRRFRASKETADKINEIEIFRNDLLSKGADLPAPKPKGEHFDSNCITPGTPFMDRLAQCLHYYVHDRMNNDVGWQSIKVILSDANVPGEGEHKIMDYIRRQRGHPDHDPNTSHCLCGADADLIMLGLATHEPNFTIIREEFKPNKPRSCDLCGQIGHEMKDCTGLAKEKQGEFDELNAPIAAEPDFIFLRLNVLREYLEKELAMHHLPFPFDLERAVDDWVFMCFFVGNDFLPHLPSLEIREGAIDRLIGLYQKTILKTGGYLTDSGKVHLERVQLILTDLGEVEDEIFKNRQENELSFQRRQKDKKKRMKMQRDRPAWTPRGQFAPNPIGNRPNAVVNPRQEAYQMRMQGMHTESRDSGNHAAANDLKAELKSGVSTDQDNAASSSKGVKRQWEHANLDSDEEEQPLDDVRLWEDGWKDRYYQNKFDVQSDNIKYRQQVAAEYCRGLCWVLKYYYQGCASWTWFFPYHYAPFASDFHNIGDLNIEFDNKTQPFKPLEQLMGVFPAASRQHIPEPWGDLMLNPDSPIIDFYPDNFKIDLNGKKFAWQGVALLPFVDEKRLLKALEGYYPLLTAAEEARNVRGDDRLYIGKFNSGYDFMMGIYEGEKNLSQEVSVIPNLFGGVAGSILIAKDVVLPNETLESILPGLPDITQNKVLCARYRDPKYPDDFIHPAKRLPNAVDPPKVLKALDWDDGGGRGWRPQIGMAPAKQRAYLDNSGHRHLNHSMGQMAGQGAYSNAPPPSMGYGNRNNDRPYRGRGGGGGGYGGGGGGRNHRNSDNRFQPYQRQSQYNQQQQQDYGHPVSTYNIRGGYGNRSDNNQYQQQGYTQQSNQYQQNYSQYQQHKNTGSRDGNRPPHHRHRSQSQYYGGSNTYHYNDQGSK